MKRFIVGLAATAILSMPMAASALEKMDNSQLRSATGQAGVSIAVDDIVIYQKSLADTTYWDTDGLAVLGAGTGSAPAAMVGAAGIMLDHADDMHKLITIDAILDADDYGVTALKEIFSTDGTAANTFLNEDIGIIDDMSTMQTFTTSGFNATTGATGNFTNGISPLTIDVGTCEALTRGWDYNTNGTQTWASPHGQLTGAVAGVVIGLPTVEITTYNTTNTMDVKLVLKNSETGGLAQAMNMDHNTFIQIEKSGNSTMAILGGRLEIAPH
ncbi:MAG: hypothetical protein RBR08_13815 [Desulforegulaceae bacterium]|nr:hypothetical protein [Desulforegulaceae bacterium]